MDQDLSAGDATVEEEEEEEEGGEEENLPDGDAMIEEEEEEENLPDGDAMIEEDEEQNLLDGDATIGEDDLLAGDASIGEEEQDLTAGDAMTEEEEEEEELGFGFKRTKRAYLKLFRRQRSVFQSCCASAFEEEGGDYECCSGPKSSEEFGYKEGNHEAVVRQATVDEKIDSSVRGLQERARNLDHLVRLLEEGKLVCSPLILQIRKLHRR